MQYEPRWKRRMRLTRQWHRKFALFPKEVQGRSVWLERYWQRFVDWPAPRTQHEWDRWNFRMKMMCSAHMIWLPWGEWEYSMLPPIETTATNVVRLVHP